MKKSIALMMVVFFGTVVLTSCEKDDEWLNQSCHTHPNDRIPQRIVRRRCMH